MGDFIIRTEPEIALRYPVAVQTIFGSRVDMGQAFGSEELLQLILDLRPGEAINIVLNAHHNKAVYPAFPEAEAGEARHLRFEVDIGLSAVPCIYVRRSL
jgi:hypothetical protein